MCRAAVRGTKACKVNEYEDLNQFLANCPVYAHSATLVIIVEIFGVSLSNHLLHWDLQKIPLILDGQTTAKNQNW